MDNLTAPRLVVFDCDGTLVDSQYAIVTAMAAAFEGCALVAPDAAAVRRIVGLSLEEAVAALAPGLGEDDCVRVADGYRRAHPAAMARHAADEHPFPGAHETLTALAAADFSLGVATGKGRRALSATLARHGLEEFFVTVQTADVNPGKPDPTMVHHAIADIGATPGTTMVVGDSTYDMEMAGNAGVVAMGVAWGYHSPDALRAAGAAGIAESFRDLTGLILDWGGGT